MTLVDEELRNTWVRLVDDQVDGEHVSTSLKILSIVTGDPRLHTRTITTARDIRETAQIVGEGIDDLELHRAGIDAPERLRDSFVRHFIERHVERVGEDLTPDELYDFEEDSAARDDRQDSSTQNEDQAVNIQTADGSKNQENSLGPVTDGADTEAEEQEGSKNSFPFYPSDINISEIVEGGELTSDLSQIAEEGFDLENSEPDIEYLRQNRSRLATAVKERDGRERLFALVGLSHLAIDSPQAVEPWVGVIEDGFEEYGETSKAVALLICLAITRDDSAALVGHLDSLLEDLKSYTGHHRAMVFDIVERISRETPEQLEGYVDYIADGLCDEIPRVRESASVVLARIAENRPDLIVSYTGILARQLEYEDKTGDLAAELIRITVETNPAAVAPYVGQINSKITSDARNEKISRLLRTLRILLIKDAITEVPFEDVIDCLGCQDENVRGEALTVCNEIAKRDSERVQREMDRIVQCAKDESEQVVQIAALVMSTMAEAQTETVEPFVEDIVALLRTKKEDDQSVDIGLNVLGRIAQDRPGIILPYIDIVVQHLQGSDPERAGLAARVLGHLARDDIDAVEPYLDQIVQTIGDFDDDDILIPLLYATQQLAKHRPQALDGYLGTIVSRTDHDTPEVVGLAAKVCHIVAKEEPPAVAAYFHQLLPLLQSGHDEVKQICIQVCRDVAGAGPSHVEERFSWLLDRVRNPDDGITESMVLSLIGIANERPALINNLPYEWYLTHEERSLQAAAITVLVVAGPEYRSILADNLERVVELLDTTDSDHTFAALNACNEVVEDYPGAVANHAEAITDFLEHDSDEHRKVAFDCIEQIARYHDPAVLKPYEDTIIAHQTDNAPEIRRDVALCLSHLGEIDEDLIQSEFYRLQQSLKDDNKSVSNCAAVAIGNVAKVHADVAQQATEQLVDWLQDDRSLSIVGLNALDQIAESHPSRLKPHLQTVTTMLSDDDEDVRKKVIHIVGRTSQTSGEAVTPYLTDLRSATEGLDVDLPMMDILYNVAPEDPKAVADQVDLAADVVENGDPAAVERALIAMYHVAKDSPEPVAPHVDSVADVLKSEEREAAVGGALVLGALSDTAPEVVEPHSELLVDYLKRVDNDDARLPAVDALYNIAVEFPDTVEPHLDVVKNIDPDDETLASLKQKLVGLYEEVHDDDSGPDPDPDYELGQATAREETYDSTEVVDSLENSKGQDGTLI